MKDSVFQIRGHMQRLHRTPQLEHPVFRDEVIWNPIILARWLYTECLLSISCGRALLSQIKRLWQSRCSQLIFQIQTQQDNLRYIAEGISLFGWSHILLWTTGKLFRATRQPMRSTAAMKGELTVQNFIWHMIHVLILWFFSVAECCKHRQQQNFLNLKWCCASNWPILKKRENVKSFNSENWNGCTWSTCNSSFKHQL